MKLGIRARFLLLGLGPATLITLALGVYLTHAYVQELERSLMDRGRQAAEQFAAACWYAGLDGHDTRLASVARSLLRQPDVIRVSVVDARGRPLMEEATGAPRVKAWAGLADWIPVGGTLPVTFEARVYQGGPTPAILTAAAPAVLTMAGARPDLLGRARLQLSRAATLARQREAVAVSAALVLAFLLVATLLSQHLAHRLSRPIRRLDRVLSQLDTRGAGPLPAPAGMVVDELERIEHGIGVLAETVSGSHRVLQEQVKSSTAELRETVEELEIRNAELDIARRRALETSQMKSDFLANISHEIRTPLNGVMGFIELLARTPLDQIQEGYLQTARSSARTLMVLLNDILDFSSLETGKLQIRARSFDLREVLEDTVSLFGANAEEKGLDLVLDVEPDLPSLLVGDPPRISQILTNLVGNAIKFTSRGEVVVRAVRVEQTAESLTLAVEVRDTGTGMGRDRCDRLLAAADAPGSLAERATGSGLGLAICQRLVDLMGGQIRVQSEPGLGSVFTVTLTLGRDASTDTPERPLLGRGVLIALGTPSVARAVQHICEFAGARVLRTGAEADLDGDWGALIVDRDSLVTLPPPVEAWDRRLVVLGPRKPHPVPSRLARLFERVEFASALPTSRELVPLLQDGAPPATLLPPAASRPAARVLLVDDNLINRQLARIFITQLGGRVDEVGNGEEAVDVCRRNTYDLILMDVHMPGMDGLEATRRIRALGEGANRRAPILALTGDTGEAERARCREAGMDGHLSKPVTEMALREALERWCQGTATAHGGRPASASGGG